MIQRISKRRQDLKELATRMADVGDKIKTGTLAAAISELSIVLYEVLTHLEKNGKTEIIKKLNTQWVDLLDEK